MAKSLLAQRLRTKSNMSDVKNPEKKTLLQQFIDFLNTFGVIGLVIAFVIGVAASALISALVKDIVNPLIGLVLPSGNLATLEFSVKSITGKASTFLYGDLISNIINFLVIAFIVFVAYKQLSKLGLFEDKTKKVVT
jgi:large conductance mechanosensitive channel